MSLISDSNEDVLVKNQKVISQHEERSGQRTDIYTTARENIRSREKENLIVKNQLRDEIKFQVSASMKSIPLGPA